MGQDPYSPGTACTHIFVFSGVTWWGRTRTPRVQPVHSATVAPSGVTRVSAEVSALYSLTLLPDGILTLFPFDIIFLCRAILLRHNPHFLQFFFHLAKVMFLQMCVCIFVLFRMEGITGLICILEIQGMGDASLDS